LLAQLRDEVRLSEFTTAFPGNDNEFELAGAVGESVSCGLPNLSIARNSSFLYNSWELQLRGLRLCGDGEQDNEDRMQRLLFGSRRFPLGPAHPSTLQEARDRIVYTAMNIRRFDLAECMYGSVRLVLSPSFVRNMSVIAPLDSGWWSGCVLGRPEASLDCAGWPAPYHVGTLDNLDHTLLAHARLISPRFNGSTIASLAHVFIRLVKPRDMGMHTSDHEDMFGYLEAALLGSVIYSQAVKAVIGRFQDLFGTDTGEALVQWCQSHQWPLLWTLGVMPKDGACKWDLSHERSHGHWENFVHPRLLEPRTSLATNITLANLAAANMSRLWKEVAEARRTSNSSPPASDWHDWFLEALEAVSARGQLRPLQAGNCRDAETCIGMNFEGDCVQRVQQELLIV